MASKSVTSTVVDELDENNGKKPTMVNIKNPTNGNRKNTKILYNTREFSEDIMQFSHNALRAQTPDFIEIKDNIYLKFRRHDFKKCRSLCTYSI